MAALSSTAPLTSTAHRTRPDAPYSLAPSATGARLGREFVEALALAQRRRRGPLVEGAGAGGEALGPNRSGATRSDHLAAAARARHEAATGAPAAHVWPAPSRGDDDDVARDCLEADASALGPDPRGTEVDLLLPANRHLAQLAPPACAHAATTAGAEDPHARGARSLEELVPELVRRIAWSGDGKRGAVRLELGAGAYAGASVIVHADGPRVRVELGGLPEGDLARLRERLDARLRAQGLDLEGIT